MYHQQGFDQFPSDMCGPHKGSVLLQGLPNEKAKSVVITITKLF